MKDIKSVDYQFNDNGEVSVVVVDYIDGTTETQTSPSDEYFKLLEEQLEKQQIL